MDTQQGASPTLDDIATSLLTPDTEVKEATKKPAPTPKSEAQGVDDDDRQTKPREREDRDPEPIEAGGDTDVVEVDETEPDDEEDFFESLLKGEAAENAEEAGDDTDADADDPVFEVKVDGKMQQVTLSQLRKAYAGEGAIEARLQQASEARKAAEAEAQQYVQYAQAAAARLKQVYEHYNEALFAPRVQPPDPQMRETDPIGYLQQQEDFRADQDRLRQEQAYMQQTLQMASQLHQQKLDGELRAEYEALTQKMPALRKPATAKAFKQAIGEAAKAYGFSPEEVSQVTDHRLLVMAAEAAAYRATKAKAKKSEVRREVSPPLPTQGSRKANGNAQKSAKLKQRKAAYDKARATGSVDDVANWLIL